MWKEGVRERHSEGLGVGWVEGGRVGVRQGERGGEGGERGSVLAWQKFRSCTGY